MIHELKTWPEEFVAVANGTKTHEARRADRPFGVGHVLRLREWIPEMPDACDWKATTKRGGRYTGRAIDVEVTHLTMGQYGFPADLAIMSIRFLTGGIRMESEATS